VNDTGAQPSADLFESQAFIRAVVDSIGAHLVVLDGNGRIVSVNEAWRRFASINGLDWRTVSENTDYLEVCDRAAGEGAENAHAIATGIRDVLAGKRRDFIMEYSFQSRGEQSWYICRVVPFISRGEMGVVVTHDNVTLVHQAYAEVAAGERQMAEIAKERALAEIQASERLRESQQLARVGSWYLDLVAGSLVWSDEIYHMFEIDKNKFGGTLDAFFAAIHPDDRAEVDRVFTSSLANRTPYQVIHRLQMSDGRIKWVEERCRSEYDDAGKPLRSYGTVQDITERKMLEIKLAEAMKMDALGKLTGGMAHDFNNYLGVIIGNLDILKDRDSDDATSMKLIEEALGGALRGAELTRSLLAFARRQPLDSKVVDVNWNIESIATLLQRTVGEDVALDFDLAPGIWPVQIDSPLLDSCFINLANNARFAMPQGGSLSISTQNIHLDASYASANMEAGPGDFILIKLSDTGKGMPPETVARVFEPFFTTKGPGHGTGLGLSMVYGFVTQSGGHINIQSDEGVGTTVCLYLPRDLGSAVMAETSPGSVPAQVVSGGAGETVLVVEDNDLVRRTVVKQLNSLGYLAVEAKNGDAALAVLGQPEQLVDLLFTDIIMPGQLNGFELSKKAAAARPGIKILLTSGFPGDAVDRLGGDALEFNMLGKPYRRNELAREVRKALDES
jgi:PAS domain S-box-containing protein